MRDIYARHGALTYRLIDDEAGMPHAALVKKMFGSLAQAYALALGPVTSDAKCFRAARTAALRSRVLGAARACIIRAGRSVAQTSSPTVLRIDGVLSVRIAVASCRKKMGCSGWVLPADVEGGDFVLCALMNKGATEVLRYALLVCAAIRSEHMWLPFGCTARVGIIYAIRLTALFGLDEAADLEPVKRLAL
jgi:hypothetical protein